MGAQIDKMTLSVGGMWHMVNDETQKGSQQVVLDFHNMYQGATDSTTRLKSGVTLAANTMSNGMVETVTYMQAQASGKFKLLHDDGSNYSENLKANITTDFFNMHKQVYSETDALTSDALAAMTRLNGDMTDQAKSMDANVIGYWNDVAAYIAGHPINGNITYTAKSIAGVQNTSQVRMSASGSDYFPGGSSWVGEGREAELVVGPHLMNVPRGSGIYPLSHLGGGGGSSGQPVQVNINIAGHNVARVLLPELVTAIRTSTAAKF